VPLQHENILNETSFCDSYLGVLLRVGWYLKDKTFVISWFDSCYKMFHLRNAVQMIPTTIMIRLNCLARFQCCSTCFLFL